MVKTFSEIIAAVSITLFLIGCDSSSNLASNQGPAPEQAPNILFIVLDDLGVDQLSSFGYGGLTPAKTPHIDAIAQAGLRFRNAWSMPTCSPTRATFFEGRYPFRTNVQAAIVAVDLANSQVSPFELTTPKLLKQKGYINALIGKMHLSGSNINPANNPLGNGVMRELGWDYFEGYLDGAPYPIDTTAGGISQTTADTGVYGCGFIPTKHDNPSHGADSGACYQLDGQCTMLSTAEVTTPGRSCLESGGLFDPNQSCRPAAPHYLDFSKQNGYYTSDRIISHPDGSIEVISATDARSRGYKTTQETDGAVRWIQQQKSDQPWMLSLGYSAIHTPLQQPPTSLLPAGSIETGSYTCTGAVEERVLTNQMIEALDTEIGRLLVETGLAHYRTDGTLDYRPEQSNTVVAIVGDNGSYTPSVKAPFNPVRAKGFVYQTGVWVPLIIAGPMVKEPGRELLHMVNATDMYSLFSEIAGVNLAEVLPFPSQVDARPMLPYLTDPSQTSLRTTNYTEMGTNIRSTAEAATPPCVIEAANVCVQIVPQQAVCQDQGGTWYGPGGVAGETGLSSCCAVNSYLAAQGKSLVDILPDSQRAIRNDSFKLVRMESMSCTSGQIEAVDEFYRIDQATPLPKLDNSPSNLLSHATLTPEEQQNYDALKAELSQLLNSHISCPGDGNLDLIVDETDLENWHYFSTLNGGNSSWYDFNHDGVTNEADRAIIQQNLGRDCRPKG